LEQQGPCIFCGDAIADTLDGPALEDGLLEEGFGCGRNHNGAQQLGACGFPHDRNTVRVAAKGGDIVVHPAKGSNDVEEAEVTGLTVLGVNIAEV